MKKISTIKVAIITNIVPSYREGFYDRLFNREELNVTVYCLDHIPGMNLKPVHEKYGDKIKIVKFIAAPKEIIVWQFLPWCEIFKNYDVVFVDGNPRVISNVLISNLLYLFRKGIVLWTMAHSFNANALNEKIRLYWSRLFKFIFVYTDAEVHFLRSIGFKNNFILGMNNGLDQKAIDAVILNWTNERLKEWRQSNSLDNDIILLSCARLDEKNKFEQVVQALPLILAKVPNVIWCVIGTGDEKNNLEFLVKTAGLEDHVRFVGPIYCEKELAPWFLSSKIFIHPAAIGLSLMHSFGYSLPVVTHGEFEQHGPEYAAFESGRTGLNFLIGNIQSLADTVVDLLYYGSDLEKMKSYVLNVVREKYNADVMVERFIAMATKVFNS